jgi:hypothetical protein
VIYVRRQTIAGILCGAMGEENDCDMEKRGLNCLTKFVFEYRKSRRGAATCIASSK